MPSTLLIAIAMLACLTHADNSNGQQPAGPAVVAGGATFSTSGNQLTVTNTPNTIINWQSFNIGPAQITRFEQQSAQSTVLNRVVQTNPSTILGTLSSNGGVFLINPNGILFGAGSRVDVGGFIASTFALSDANFLAGNIQFTQGASPAEISAQGSITSSGILALWGSTVSLSASSFISGTNVFINTIPDGLGNNGRLLLGTSNVNADTSLIVVGGGSLTTSIQSTGGQLALTTSNGNSGTNVTAVVGGSITIGTQNTSIGTQNISIGTQNASGQVVFTTSNGNSRTTATLVGGGSGAIGVQSPSGFAVQSTSNGYPRTTLNVVGGGSSAIDVQNVNNLRASDAVTVYSADLTMGGVGRLAVDATFPSGGISLVAAPGANSQTPNSGSGPGNFGLPFNRTIGTQGSQAAAVATAPGLTTTATPLAIVPLGLAKRDVAF